METVDKPARGGRVARLPPASPLLWTGLSMSALLLWYQLAFRTAATPLVSLSIEWLARPRGDLPWLAALVAATLTGAASSTRRIRKNLGTARDGKAGTVALASALVCSAGTAFMYLTYDKIFLSCMGGVACGAGFALLASCLSFRAPRTASRTDLFASGCIALVVAQVVQIVSLFIHTVLLQLLLCLSPLVALGTLRKAHKASQKDAESPYPPRPEVQEFQLRSHMTVVALCFVGLGVYMGIIGFANDSLQPAEYLAWQLATTVPGCVIACLVLWFSSRASVEGPYVVSPIMLGTAALVLLLTVMSASLGNDGTAGEALAHTTGRATDGFLFVMAAATIVEIAQSKEGGALIAPAGMLALSALSLLSGIVVGGAMMSVVGLSVLSITLVAVSLVYGALLSLGLSVQQRSRDSYVVVRSSLDVQKIARAQATMLAEELGTLTAREAEVLPYLLQHLSAETIAERLGISRNTVKTHIAHIYKKASVDSRRQLIDIASSKVINL